jgi:HAD superfamily hydrolase (TIGR01509 family)
MALKAIFFGAIGTIAETSDVQRRAFNHAFADAGLDWNWDADIYRHLLTINGGRARIRAYCEQQRKDMLSAEQIAAIHTGKTRHYAKLLASEGLQPRPGVVQMMHACAAANIAIGLCTSTSMDNVNAIEIALNGRIDFAKFAIITTLSDGVGVKPLPDAYHYALRQLRLDAAECVAIEDSPVSIAAAKAADIFTIATPGAFVRDQDFGAADWICDDISAVSLGQMRALVDNKS